MGNALFYLNRHAEAEKAWLNAVEQDPVNASLLRSLAFAGWSLRKDTLRAIALLEKASAADPADIRMLQELDYFLDAVGDTERRVELLSERESTVQDWDELVVTHAMLMLRTRNYEKAAVLMDKRQFFARQKRVNKHAVYAEAHYGIGEQLIATGKFEKGINEIKKGMEYPDNLAEGSFAREVYSRAYYLLGVAHKNATDITTAEKYFREIIDIPDMRLTENKIYLALALKELGREREAETLLDETESLCHEKLEGGKSNDAQLYYILSCVSRIQGKAKEADTLLKKALSVDQDVILHSRIAASRALD